jgi:cholesterol oxidase
MVDHGTPLLDSFPPYFGARRKMEFPPLERINFVAGDGSALVMHHTSGGTRGPVIITPGTAMTALSYCIDTVPQNLVEFLVAQGFDLWLADWRTSPLLAAHQHPYTLDDVARYDWPAIVAEVRRRTQIQKLAVLAHCLSSPCFLLSLLRGYTDRAQISCFVASQVALHLHMTPVGALKLKTRMDRLLPSREMMHQRPADKTAQLSDVAVSFLSHVLPKSYSCDNPVCSRHSATFGDLIFHARVNAATHALMGDLVPECLTAFLQDVANWARQQNILTAEDHKHLDRLQLPITLISGAENQMFVAEATALSFELLCDANGKDSYRRTVYKDFGHLDCYIGEGASTAIWPDLANALEQPGSLSTRAAG